MELSFKSCNISRLTVKGYDLNQYKPGYVLNYINTFQYCGRCSPLFRRIEAIINGPTADTKTFTTSMATFQDIFTSDLYDTSIAKIEIENAINCSEILSLAEKQTEINDHKFPKHDVDDMEQSEKNTKQNNEALGMDVQKVAF
jgi:hypothetical protein